MNTLELPMRQRRLRLVNRSCAVLVVLCTVTMIGCGNLPSELQVPNIDPEVVALELISSNDLNGDGMLSGRELKAPTFGLRYSVLQIDSDGNREVTAEEIRDYVQRAWIDAGGAVISTRAKVTYKNRALRGAKVTLEPVEYLSDVIKPASGVVEGGLARLDMTDEDRPHENARGANCGLYVVRISMTQGGAERIPSKYNTDSVLTCEVAPRAGYMPGPLVFDLK